MSLQFAGRGSTLPISAGVLAPRGGLKNGASLIYLQTQWGVRLDVSAGEDGSTP